MTRRHVTDTYAASQERPPPPPLPARPSPGLYKFSRSESCPLISTSSQSGPSDPLTPSRRLHTDCNPLYPTSPGPRLPSCAAALGKGSPTADMAAALDQSDSPKHNGQDEGEEQEQQPIDIRARVAAFEKRSDTAAAPPPPPPRKLVYAKPDPSTVQSANGSVPPPPVSISHGSPARPSVTTQDIISRVNVTPRSRDDLTPGTTSSSPSLRSVPSFSGTTAAGSDSPSEFGVLSPLSSRSLGTRLGGAASTSSSSLPLPSSNGRSLGTSPGVALSPFSAAYKGNSTGLAHTVGPSPSHSSQFDALAEAGSVKRVGSGTSLNDLTTSSIARARERSAGVAGVSGKVPLPPSGVPGGSMANGSSSSLGVFMPSDVTGSSSGAGSTGGRASPALPPRSGLASTRGLHKRSSGSLSQISDAHSAAAPAYAMRRNRSTTESPLPSPSVRSLHPLDDDENEAAGRERGEGNYGLILHPTLRPTTSPVASRPASRASNPRSVPSSPQVGLPEAADLLSVQHRVRVGVQPPTPSPEKHPEGNFSMAKAPYLSLYEPRRNHSIDSTASSSEGKEVAEGRSQQHRGQAPSLPPRAGIAGQSSSTGLPYLPYKQRAGSGSGLMLSSSSAGGAVASKVPPPPSMPSTSLPSSSHAPAIPPRQSGAAGPRHSTGNSPAASVTSSPAQSPKLAAATKFTQRSSRSAGPVQDALPRSSGSGPSSSCTGLAAIQPPPSRSRLRSSSEGPLGELRAQHAYDGRAHGQGHGAANGEAYHLTPTAASSAPIARDTFHGTLAYRSSQASLYGKRTAAAAGGGTARFKPARSLAPVDEAARKRYEDVWEREVQRMERRKQRKSAKQEKESGSSGVDIESTIGKSKTGGGGVASLASRFESTSPSSSTPLTPRPPVPRTSRKPSVPLSITTPSSSVRLPARRVGRLWRKSRLPEVVLSQIWLAALAWDRDCEAVLSPTPPETSPLPSLGAGAGMSLGGAFAAQRNAGKAGVSGSGTGSGIVGKKDKGSTTPSANTANAGPSKEAFVRALAAIDAELAYRAEGRAQRKAVRAGMNAGASTTPVGGVSPAATGAGMSTAGGSRAYAVPHTYSAGHGYGHGGDVGATGGTAVGGRRRMPPLAPGPAHTHAGGE